MGLLRAFSLGGFMGLRSCYLAFASDRTSNQPFSLSLLHNCTSSVRRLFGEGGPRARPNRRLSSAGPGSWQPITGWRNLKMQSVRVLVDQRQSSLDRKREEISFPILPASCSVDSHNDWQLQALIPDCWRWRGRLFGLT